VDRTGSVALDRQAVRRVLRRATELEATALPRPDDDRVDPDALVAAAAEAGIPEPAVRRALALERLGPAPRRRGMLLGTPVVVAEAEVQGSPDEVLRRVDDWLVAGHHLRRDRLHGGAGAWSRRRGLVGSTFRMIRHATGEGYLGDLERIDATAVDAGERTCVVRVAADRRRERRFRGAAGAAVVTVTSAAAAVGAVVLSPVLLVAAPVSAVAGAGIAVGGRRRATRLAGVLDRVLDSVEHGVRPTRLGTHFAKRVVDRRQPG
jgi:hypothetical protein